MSYSILETKIVWGATFPDVMNGVQDVKKDGWKPLGMPTPLVIDDVYGMMHMVYKDRSKG
jgi:hypothetical protein